MTSKRDSKNRDSGLRRQADEALRESEALLQEIGEMAKVGGWELDLSTNQVSWTEEVCRIHGVGPGYQPKLENALNFYAPESRPDVEAALKKIAETGEPYDLESLFIPSGSKDKIWVRSLGKAVYSGGKVVKINGTFQNIDKYKRMEEALKVSASKYKTLFESFPLGITISDTDGNILETNKEAERLLGLSAEEQAKRKIGGSEWRIIRPDGSPMPADEYTSVRALKENRLIENVEMGIVKDDSDVTWINVTATPIPLEGYGVVIAYGDITQRKLTKEKLQVSEALLKEAQGVAHIGHWELDMATMVPAWSEEIFHIFGIDPAMGEPSFAAHRDLLHQDDWDILNNAVSATSTTGAPFDIEFRLLHPLKGLRWMLAIGRAIRNDKGNISRLFGTAQNITDSKNIEENLQKSRQELHGLSERLISSMKEWRTLLAREIHDELGQALTALKMDLSWLSKKLPEGQVPLAGKIASMLSLVDNTVKTVKRLSTELRPGMLDDLGLVAAMEWQAGEFQERTGIKTELGFEPADIVVDNEQATVLFRIFQEVLTNVARHAAATRIDVYLREKDGVLELSVRDNGKGIEQTMVNSPYSLGLIGMRERCHHLGGTIDIRGKRVKGTTVIVKLPVKEMRQ